MFIMILIKKHHNVLLHYRPWKCVICNQPAQELINQATPDFRILDRGLANKPGFKGIAIPICGAGGRCHRMTVERVNRQIKEARSDVETMMNCGVCGRISGVEQCEGCMLKG